MLSNAFAAKIPAMRRVLAFILVALAATPTGARPFKDMCEQFEPLRKLEGLKYVKPLVRVQPKEPVKPQDVTFTIAAKAGPILVTPGPEGTLQFPFSDALCAENPDISINQPKGTVSLNISIDPRLPPARTVDYRLLESLRHEWDEAISRQSLMWRVMAPGAKAYEIAFAPGSGASAEIRLPQGPRRLAADDKGIVRIPFEDAWIAANPTIVLSETPQRIGLAFKH
jgi:hypothetical protein